MVTPVSSLEAADWEGIWVSVATDSRNVQMRSKVTLDIWDLRAGRDQGGQFESFKCKISNDFVDRGRQRDCSGLLQIEGIVFNFYRSEE